MTSIVNSNIIGLKSTTSLSAVAPAQINPQNVVSTKLQGIVFDQNLFNNYITCTDATEIFQTFTLPSDYARSKYKFPDIVGFQIFTESRIKLTTSEDQASLHYRIERSPDDGKTWYSLATGEQAMSVPANNTKYLNENFTKIWFNVSFGPIKMDANWIGDTFRLVINNFSKNIDKVYYQSPNPLVTESGVVTGKWIGNQDASIAFRIFAAIADSGTDFLNNKYRSSVFIANPENVTSVNDNQYWISKPNPSKFGVESLYFDISKNNQAIDVDSVFINPTTLGMTFNVYYSNDPTGPGVDDVTWDNLLWTRISKTYSATKKQSYVFPNSISAKYIKIEFSNLQAKTYSPGDFQLPIKYKKYPQWVFDYFIADYQLKRNKTYDPYIQGQVTVDMDIYALAFNYYRNDIIQTPAGTIEIQDYESDKSKLLGILGTGYDTVNQNMFNATTRSQIQIAFRKFESHPSTYISNVSTIGKLAGGLASSTSGLNVSGYKIAAAQNYPTEITSTASSNTIPVSTLERDSLLQEKQIPPMFFYVTCRHEYKESYAKFENNKGYYAGVSEVMFQRQNHTAQYDSLIYNYGISEDSLNVARNDFTLLVDSNTNSQYWSAR